MLLCCIDRVQEIILRPASQFRMKTISVASSDFAERARCTLRDADVRHVCKALQNPVVEALTESVVVVGPGWRKVEQNEIKSLDDSDYHQLVAVRNKEFAMLPRRSWTLEEVVFEFLGDEGVVVAALEVELDGESFEFRFQKWTESVTLESELRTLLVEIVFRIVPRPQLPAAPLEALLSATKTSFSLPNWILSLFVSWLSSHLRLHVLTAAAFADSNAFVPMIVDYGRINEVGSSGAHRVLVIMHRVSAKCFCPLHSESPILKACEDVQVAVSVEFCGARLEAGRICPIHGSTTGQLPSNILSRVCVQNMRLSLKCLHVSKGEAPPPATVLKLPATDVFLKAFAAATIELMDPKCAVPNIRHAVENVARLSRTNDRERRAVSRETMLKRDQIAETALRTKRFAFGSKRRKGSIPRMRERRDGSEAPAWLRDTTDHAHLFKPY